MLRGNPKEKKIKTLSEGVQKEKNKKRAGIARKIELQGDLQELSRDWKKKIKRKTLCKWHKEFVRRTVD